MAMRRWIMRRQGAWLAVLLVLGLGGCATGPEYPLLSPIAAARTFGYSEAPIGPDRYLVSYVTPTRIAGFYGGPHAAEANEARTIGYDMAVWRAAQLAQAQGFLGFRVTDRRSDVNIYPNPYDYDVGPPYWGPYWNRWSPFWGPYGPYRPFPPRANIVARVSIEVLLLHDLKPGDYNAQDAIRQLQATYPGAAGVRPAA
jgi:hypothetical protein